MMLLKIFFALTLTVSSITSFATTIDSTHILITDQFMGLLNDHRAELGLKPLLLDEELSEIVQAHTDEMAKGEIEFGHGGFSERCTESRKVLGGGNLCSENVAMGQKTAQAAFTAWMNSPGHKKNIEQPRSTHTGFAFQQNKDGKYYWTQIFLER
jgi:uncharacterized protein YkwD